MSKADSIDATLPNVLEAFAERGVEKVHRDIPGKVITYDAATQTADIQPMILIAKNDNLRPLAIARQVQVRWPAGSTWSIVGDLTPPTPATGSYGWLRFAGGDISAWKMQGTESDLTAIPRKGALSDCVFEPGSQPIGIPLAADAWKAGALVIKAAELLLGSSTATDPVSLSSIIDAIVVTIAAAFDPHVHADPASGVTGTPITPLLAAISIGPQPSTAATKVKAI